MPVSFQEILTAFEFVGFTGLGEHLAILCPADRQDLFALRIFRLRRTE
jgi:hypothetical protein